jgi:hypothetical protein
MRVDGFAICVYQPTAAAGKYNLVSLMFHKNQIQ